MQAYTFQHFMKRWCLSMCTVHVSVLPLELVQTCQPTFLLQSGGARQLSFICSQYQRPFFGVYCDHQMCKKSSIPHTQLHHLDYALRKLEWEGRCPATTVFDQLYSCRTQAILADPTSTNRTGFPPSK